MKKVLFACVENSCRSQMAEALARDLGGDKISSFSAGSRPSGRVNEKAIEAMKEAGIDISGGTSKGFDDLPVKDFDYVITMGCKDVCPFVPAKEHINWELEDPKGKDIDFFRKTRDRIKEKVSELIDTL